MSNNPTRAGLEFRSAMGDWAHVAADITAEGSEQTPPLVTIGIPTYRRPDLLAEAVRSVIDQQFESTVEIVVVDNDPASQGARTLLDSLPQLVSRNFRYFVNRKNIGLFPNWNRCIEMARGEWVSVLNDDDLLDPDFLTTMIAEIARKPGIDGIVCNKRWFGGLAAANPPSAKSAVWQLWQRLADRAIFELNFLGRRSRRILPRKFFWGAVLGNGGGFLFRRSKALEVGGYYPEEYPSSDLWFYTRFASIGHLRQHRAFAASIRRTEGAVSSSTITGQLEKGFRLQHILAGTVAPRWWRRLLPTMIAHYRADFARDWDVTVPAEEVELALGIKLPKHRPRLYNALRLLLSGH